MVLRILEAIFTFKERGIIIPMRTKLEQIMTDG